jgi:hypothetical protein
MIHRNAADRTGIWKIKCKDINRGGRERPDHPRLLQRNSGARNRFMNRPEATWVFSIAGHMPGAISQDVNEEIRFLTYRLEVLAQWPKSPDRDARIAATHSRLKMLLAPQPGAALKAAAA